MNLLKTEKIVQCYEGTGILDVWSSKKHDLYEEAVGKRHSLFPNMIDESSSSNDDDDQHQITGLVVRMETLVDKDTGAVTFVEREEDDGIEKQLVHQIADHTASLGVSEQVCDGGGESGEHAERVTGKETQNSETVTGDSKFTGDFNSHSHR